MNKSNGSIKNNLLFVILGVIIGALWMQTRKQTNPASSSKKSRTAEEISPRFKAWSENFDRNKADVPMPSPITFSKAYDALIQELVQPELTELEAVNVKTALSEYVGVMTTEMQYTLEKFDIPTWEDNNE